jgi:DNA-binding XRE family transcriptional regulator
VSATELKRYGDFRSGMMPEPTGEWVRADQAEAAIKAERERTIRVAPGVSSLKVRRVAAGLTQNDLQAISGVSRGRIIALESGEGLPRLSSALAIASALGCSVSDLWPGLYEGRVKA